MNMARASAKRPISVANRLACAVSCTMRTSIGPARPIDILLRPFLDFAELQAAAGILLLACTAAALSWANLYPEHYAAFFAQTLTVSLGGAGLSKPLLLWINDGLMSVFFFVVGLEIKREIIEGELSELRQATLPIAAALGGMIVPAGIYLALNGDGPGRSGWGIPMATDIAFAVGILALLGSRVPIGLKIFLTALAIVDDIGAVVVIAIFYTDHVSTAALLGGGACLLLSVLANGLRLRHPALYFFIGLAVWFFFLKSGVHATIAAILMAFTIPAKTRIDVEAFKKSTSDLLKVMSPKAGVFMDERNSAAVHSIEASCEAVMAPAQRLEHALHSLVVFVVMPVFALANAGVRIELGSLLDLLSDNIALGTILGLFLGKQIGIFLFSWLCIKSGIGRMPASVTLGGIYGTAVLGGIGFTMSLFIAGLALPDPALLQAAKAGILAGSLISGLLGYAVLRLTLKGAPE
jgi:NhaA family Na+:H+ antiporter